MGEYYTLKEIILGLRKEQLRIASKLQDLEKKLDIYGKKEYEGSSLIIVDVISTKQNPHKLSLLLQEKYTFIENFIYALTFRFKEIERGKISFNDLIKTQDANYRLFGAKIKEEEKRSFSTLADQLLNDQFVKNAFLFLPSNPNERFRNYLNIHPCNSSYYCSSRRKSNDIEYNARTDSLLLVKQSSSKTYQEIINELLMLKFPKKHFSEYFQNIIENCDDRKKDIIIPNDKIYRGQAEFYLNDEINGYVLVKKK